MTRDIPEREQYGSTEIPPLSEQETAVLQAIYDYFREHAAWPTFITIDRPIRRAHGWDTAAIVQSLPESVIVASQHGRRRPIADDELRLRLLGFLAVRGSSSDTERFVRLLRWLAEREMAYEPTPGDTSGMPQLTSQQVAQYLGFDVTDQLGLRRLLLMLQLDHWGIAGTSEDNAGGWIVRVGPDIWRFRNVQTIEDCVQAREDWLAEGRPVVPEVEANGAVQIYYFHVRLTPNRLSPRYRHLLDLSADALEQEVLDPYYDGRAIVADGVITRIEDITKIRIVRTERPTKELPQRSPWVGDGVAYVPANGGWELATNSGTDVTNDFIKGSPGRPAAQSAPTPARPPSAPAPPPYVNKQVIDAIRARDGQSRFNVTKLLGLIAELNDNYASRNSYASHALLRAILDHIPPILGCAHFDAVASNYAWGQSDKKYIRRLADFRTQADDALHRQIGRNADLLDFEDLPASICVDRLLQECAGQL
jgi:hypothetical protein